MKKYLILGITLIIIVTSLGLFIKYNPFEEPQKLAVRDKMQIRDISERNDVPIEALIPVLPPEKRTNAVTTLLNLHKPIKELKLDKEKIKKAIVKAKAEGFPTADVVRYILWSIWIAAAGLILILRKKISRIRIIWLLATLTIFGLILGASPNPMEAIVKFHKLFRQISGNPIIFVTLNFLIFTLLSIFGAKMLCSWGCQLGALQESIYNIPIFKKFKENYKFPFAASIAVRITIYLTFFVLFFKILNINQGGPHSIFYHHLNSFKIYNFYDLALFTLLLIPVILIASLFIYRPFCQTICPFGLWSWLLENIAIYKVRKIDPAKCDDCHECEKACPTEAMKAINENKRKYFLPDCWSCGKCIEACELGLMQFTTASEKRKAIESKLKVKLPPKKEVVETELVA